MSMGLDVVFIDSQCVPYNIAIRSYMHRDSIRQVYTITHDALHAYNYGPK